MVNLGWACTLAIENSNSSPNFQYLLVVRDPHTNIASFRKQTDTNWPGASSRGLLVSCDQVQGFCQHPTQVSIQVAVKLSLKQGVVVFGSEPQVGSETMIVAPTGISGIEITHKEDCNDRAKILCCF
ncbi:predicted protein [Histoplasma capsulatum H143]|uniref:Uncharacterized protein n=1 Tax=Ajellomyces capsulatus (strain H143) TaxID=544712 RepID=C6HGV6_AJECH|nr:predicted protein [Histoplasma capsulatum H143]